MRVNGGHNHLVYWGKGGVELVEGASSLIGANRAIIDPRKLTELSLVAKVLSLHIQNNKGESDEQICDA